jgi:glycerol-3-phosphate O-acyltransferase
VRQALDNLTVHGVVSRFEGATDTVYRVQPEQHLAAAYYRNTIIHFFLNDAITELALLHVAEYQPDDPAHALTDDALVIRDHLKFDFFFSPSEIFEEEIRDVLRRRDSDFRSRLAAGGARQLLNENRPFRAPAILRPYLEAYQVVGDVVERQAYRSTIDASELAKEAMALGKQYLLQGKIRSPESVSSSLFDAAIKLAANRNLLKSSSDMVERRLEFGRSLRELVHRIEVLDTIDAARDIGVLE